MLSSYAWWNNHFYYISQLVRALLLVNFAGRTLLYGPLNLKISFSARPINLRDIINILLTSISAAANQAVGCVNWNPKTRLS